MKNKRYVLYKLGNANGYSCSIICARTNSKTEASTWKRRFSKSIYCSVYDLADKRPLFI